MNPLNDQICIESLKKIMEIFGGKWNFLIMGELHEHPKRFNELSRNLNISTRSLSNALKSLESNEIIQRSVIPTIPITVEYSLTEKGRDFENVFLQMKKWGEKLLTFE